VPDRRRPGCGLLRGASGPTTLVCSFSRFWWRHLPSPVTVDMGFCEELPIERKIFILAVVSCGEVRVAEHKNNRSRSWTTSISLRKDESSWLAKRLEEFGSTRIEKNWAPIKRGNGYFIQIRLVSNGFGAFICCEKILENGSSVSADPGSKGGGRFVGVHEVDVECFEIPEEGETTRGEGYRLTCSVLQMWLHGGQIREEGAGEEGGGGKATEWCGDDGGGCSWRRLASTTTFPAL
jgi:hypothetical protein